MKRILMITAALAAAVGIPSQAGAGDLESGLFLGAAANVQWVRATGTWGDHPYDATAPMNPEDGGAVGFSWTERFLLGAKPLVGYRFGSRWSLQLAYAANLPKSSQQTYAEQNSVAYYEQGLTTEWKQRGVEILVCYHPDSDLGYYVYGGLDMTRIDMSILLWEGTEFSDGLGDQQSALDTDQMADDTTAHGVILGAGIELLNTGNRTRVFAAAQYSTARTGGDFFGTEDFDVDVGGISFVLGLRWFPFTDP